MRYTNRLLLLQSPSRRQESNNGWMQPSRVHDNWPERRRRDVDRKNTRWESDRSWPAPRWDERVEWPGSSSVLPCMSRDECHLRWRWRGSRHRRSWPPNWSSHVAVGIVADSLLKCHQNTITRAGRIKMQKWKMREDRKCIEREIQRVATYAEVIRRPCISTCAPNSIENVPIWQQWFIVKLLRELRSLVICSTNQLGNSQLGDKNNHL